MKRRQFIAGLGSSQGGSELPVIEVQRTDSARVADLRLEGVRTVKLSTVARTNVVGFGS